MKNKEFYIDVYENIIEVAKADFIKENGSLEEFDYCEAEGDYIHTVEGVVGYYLYYYGDEALTFWLSNTKGKELDEDELLITKILKELF